MSIPLWIILVPLAVVTACAALFLFFNVFHLARYGIVGRGATGLIVVYIASFLFIALLGAGVLLQIDWTQYVSLNSVLPFLPSSKTSSFGL